MPDTNANGSKWFNPQITSGTLLQLVVIVAGGLYALGEMRTKIAVLEERIERKFEAVSIELRSIKREARDRFSAEDRAGRDG